MRLGAPLVLAAVLLAACAPEIEPSQTKPMATPILAGTVPSPEEDVPTGTSLSPTPTDVPRVVTPRGDALEATDPETIVLASGGLQLVEFFAFW
jgi:hypothetical protein